MADIETRAVQIAGPVVVAVNRYILVDLASKYFTIPTGSLAIQINLNGGTCTYAFQQRVRGSGGPWQAALGIPSLTGTPAGSGTTSELWTIDTSGKETAINVTVATGSPQLSYTPAKAA